MIRAHPRFENIAIIFVSAIQVADPDRLRGYEAGAVDYVPVPVIPEVLRAKVKVFAELYRKTRQLEQLNAQLEQRVAERTAALEASTARLQESEQRRSLAMAAGRMGSWDWDLITGDYVWDRAQYHLFGRDSESFTPGPETVLDAIHPDDRPLVARVTSSALETGQPFDIEFRILHPEGEERWCVTTAAATCDAAGRAVRLSGVTYDITERKKAERALITLNDELEHRIEERTREREQALAQLFEAQKMDTIGQLTGGVAHDFNNLLMAILGSLDLLRKRLPDDARMLRLLDNARQGAERGAALTQRLLAFARRQELKPEAVNLAKLIGGMEELLQRASGPGVRITKNLPANLGLARVDANQLELALLNLAVNARDAMPVGGTLGVFAYDETSDGTDGLAPGSYIRVSVSDSGMGMDEATLAKATEPFFTTKGPGKGTGLGLSMVQGLAAQSNGFLRLASQPGKGTTVDLWLPRADLDASAPLNTQEPAEVASQVTFEVLPCAILLVDDDALVSIGTAAMLEDLGHTVVEASSAMQALAVLQSGTRIDLVITDHAMPGMSGMELAHRLKESHPFLPVILATGYAELPHDIGNSRELPRLSKPYSQRDLAATIRTVSGASVAQGNVVPIRKH
jgi:signal transduction histidine kinase/ActR/RegA family two-component response regulator